MSEQVRDVWAIFAFGFTGDYTVKTISFQRQAPSRDLAEAMGVIEWRKEYSKGRGEPRSVAIGPFIYEPATPPIDQSRGEG